MTVLFTKEEFGYIDKRPFNWGIKENAPENIKASLRKKLRLLYNDEITTLSDEKKIYIANERG